MATPKNSSFLDMAAWRQTMAATVEDAYGWKAGTSYVLPADQALTVGIMLDRVADPTALLQQDWGARQKTLADLQASDTLWTTYGADAGTYAVVKGALDEQGIAARLSSAGHDFWGFSAANERGTDGGSVTHLWSYGLNTWGWEDLSGGGDEDFNDVLMQLDFTSASGSQWLM